MRNQWIVVALAGGLFGSFLSSAVSYAEQPLVYKAETRIYLVQTDITGNGLTSQPMPGVNGSYQIVHEKLGNVELAMEGKNLTWNGAAEPNDPRIVPVAAPTAVVVEGEKATMIIGTECRIQYFECCADGRFELKTFKGEESPDLGLTIGLRVRRVPDRPGELACDFSFSKVWIRERERIEGVALDVGKPILGEVGVKGALGARLGEWVCYQTSTESEGVLYLFIRISEESAPAENASKH